MRDNYRDDLVLANTIVYYHDPEPKQWLKDDASWWLLILLCALCLALAFR